MTETNTLKQIRMSLGIRVKKIRKESNDNRAIITEMAISTEENNFVPVLKLDSDGKNLSVLQFNSKVDISNTSFVNEHLKNLSSFSVGMDNINIDLPPDTLQHDLLHEFKSCLRFIPDIRRSNKQVNSRFYEDLSTMDEQGSDLISLMHHMHLNEKERFNKIESICKRMLPGIAEIHPSLIQNNTYTLAIKKKYNPTEIVLGHEGSGIDQLLIMIWLIATAKPGSIWFIDEPELHLHPGAQKILYDFFIEETKNDKQIFVTSHSMVFIYKSTLEQVTLLTHSGDGTNGFLLQDLVTAEQLNSAAEINEITRRIYEALGYSPTFALEPGIIVMVEGKTDERVLTSFSQILGSPIDQKMTRFLVAGGKSDAKNFSPILLFAISNKKCLIVLDNDVSNPRDLKNDILNIEKNYRAKIDLGTPLLTDSNFYPFPERVYSIEYYLLNAEAICKAFNCTEQQIRTMIEQDISGSWSDIEKKQIKPKELLKEICERHFQSYHDIDSPSRIASGVSIDHLNNFPEIIRLIELISK